MVTSVDGATAVDGLSGALGGEGDKAVFRAVRALADAIVVGAGTAVAENYGPPILTDELIAIRVANGQARLPRIVVVSNSLQAFFGPDSAAADGAPVQRLFHAEGFRPTVITSGRARADRIEALREVADVVTIGDDVVNLAAMFAQLRAEEVHTALVEGGPTFNGHLVAGDLVDEMALTFAPALVAGPSGRLAMGDAEAVRPMRLQRILEADDHLFLRYVRDRS